MNAFVTGSRVYGTPRPESDIDLCVVVSEHDLALLSERADEDPGSGGHSLRFGKLNLIVLGQRSFEAWQEATNELVAMKPVTREKAVELIKAKVRQKHSTPRKELASATA